MATLSDADIRERIESGDIVIEPISDAELQIQPSSFDVHLGREFTYFVSDASAGIDPVHDDMEDITETVVADEGEPYLIQPGEFILATTVEHVEIPRTIKCDVRGRSSYGRLGVLVHATAGLVDAGYCGQITLEMKNINQSPIKLYPGVRIGQLTFELLETPAERHYGEREDSKYQGQEGVEVSRVNQDTE